MMMLMSMNFSGYFRKTTKNLQYLLIFSMLLICIAPMIAESRPFMNNYVPILHNIFFIIGLGLFFACFFIISIFSILSQDKIALPLGLLGFAICVSFADSAYKLQYASSILDAQHYYELLFWGCGHLFQFLYLSGMLIIWYNLGGSLKIEQILFLNCFIVYSALFVQFFLAIEDSYYIYLFTEHMKIFGSITFFVAIIDITISYYFGVSIRQQGLHSTDKLGFLLSLLLFGSGGVIALFISGSNAVIPAHYHGSIVGITIGFMSYIYKKTDRIFTQINKKSASMQLVLYAIGQLIHILGLSVSGGYGALRKTPGVDLPLLAKIALGFMGAGGLLAIVAGLIFVYICGRSVVTYYKYSINESNKTFCRRINRSN
ncbi:MAG: hypothetical protein EB127_09245 [Alphaproteobacteria bacterium]|nr:hypothetical protein [Alphaproteobacteria bacterium]